MIGRSPCRISTLSRSASQSLNHLPIIQTLSRQQQHSLRTYSTINHNSQANNRIINESSSQSLRHFTTHVGAPLRKKVTVTEVQKLYQKRVPISMCTAYSYPSAVHVDLAGTDILLVGDSLAMVELGYDSTLPVSVDAMIHHCSAVYRGAERCLLVADLPFGSYESCPKQAFDTAVRFLKEANMDAVKLEGGKTRAATVRHLVENGIAVMGHIGLTPQSISVLGGFRAQGKTYAAALKLIDDALALQEAGCFAIVIECVPSVVAAAITKALSIPTIGIGAGPECSGQVLVYHDLLGFFEHAHHAKVSPKFSKTYANVGQVIQKGLEEYNKEVKSRAFPSEKYSPYSMNTNEEQLFTEKLEAHLQSLKQRHQESSQSSDTDETIKVY